MNFDTSFTTNINDASSSSFSHKFPSIPSSFIDLSIVPSQRNDWFCHIISTQISKLLFFERGKEHCYNYSAVPHTSIILANPFYFQGQSIASKSSNMKPIKKEMQEPETSAKSTSIVSKVDRKVQPFPHHLLSDFQCFVAHECFGYYMFLCFTLKAIRICLATGTKPNESQMLTMLTSVRARL